MKQKRIYCKPTIITVALYQQHLLAGSNQSTGPSADFMSNPGISEEE